MSKDEQSIDEINKVNYRSKDNRSMANNYAEHIARELCQKLEDPEGIKFYLKVAREFTQFEIDKKVALAIKYGRNKGAYFNRLITKV